MQWVEEFGFELRREVLIRIVGAEILLVESPCAGFDFICLGVVAALDHLFPVPLRVGQLAGNDWCIGGDRVNTPMNEDAKFCLGVPAGYRPLVERIPGRLVCLRVQTPEQ